MDGIVGPQSVNPSLSGLSLFIAHSTVPRYRCKSETPVIRKVANYVRRKKLSGATRSLHRDRRKNVLSAAASHSGSLKFANATCRNETSRQRLFYLGETPARKKCPLREIRARGIYDLSRLSTAEEVFPFLGLLSSSCFSLLSHSLDWTMRDASSLIKCTS